jgi:hypothetical protein
MREESKRCEQVEYGVEPPRPPSRHPPHVPSRVAEILGRSALARDIEQIFRVVETVYVVPELSEQMSVATLATGYVQHSRADGQSKNIDETRYFLAIAL